MNDEILLRVIQCMKKIKDVDSLYVCENYNEKLTGSIMKYTSIEMIYLTLELMEEFKISFNKNDFNNYNFNSITDIVNIIEAKIN